MSPTLMEDVVLGSTQGVQIHLSLGVDPNVSDRHGCTPLTVACRSGTEEMVQLLVQGNASVNLPGALGVTPLMECVKTARFSTAEYLIAHGADPNATDDRSRTALFRTVSMQPMFCAPPVQTVRELLSYGANADVVDMGGASSLLAAIIAGNVSLAEILVAAGADVTLPDLHGNAPLLQACAKGYCELSALLMRGGACVDTATNNGVSALMQSVLHREHLETLNLLVAHGARLDAVCSNGVTALMYAAESGYSSAVATLVAAGASASIQSNNGCTAMMFAAWSGDELTVLPLLSQPHDPTHLDSKGNSCLIMAVAAEAMRGKGCQPIIFRLIDDMYDPYHANKSGNTAHGMNPTLVMCALLRSLCKYKRQHQDAVDRIFTATTRCSLHHLPTMLPKPLLTTMPHELLRKIFAGDIAERDAIKVKVDWFTACVATGCERALEI
jgi:ankyrin repeat protein